MQSPSGCPVKYIICQLKQIVKYENRPGTTRNGNIMAVAKKLPSGSWRCQVYSHTEEIPQPDGTVKKKRIYESFTNDDPTTRGKRQCEKQAADWAANKEHYLKKNNLNLTFRQAIDKCINFRDSILSATTISDYNSIKKNAFVSIMDKKLSELDEETLQAAINEESIRPSKNCSKNPRPLSPKRVLNEWGLVASVINKYGLKESKSISGDYITIVEVVVDVDRKPLRKSLAKNYNRNRRHKIPPYIHQLIDQVDGDIIVPASGKEIYRK